MIIESDFSTGRAETYLGWLLGEVSKVISSSGKIVLDAELSAVGSNSQLQSVYKVVIKPQLVSSTSKEVGGQVSDINATAKRDVATGRCFEVLKAAGLDETDIQRMIEDQTSIKVTLRIRFKQKRRSKPMVMDSASRLLCNVPEDDMVLTGPGGRQKNGRIVKLSYRPMLRSWDLCWCLRMWQGRSWQVTRTSS